MTRWVNWWTEQGLHYQTRLERLRKTAIRRKPYPIQEERDWFCREVVKIKYMDVLLPVLLALLLTGCAAAASPLPPYLVKVTTPLPLTPVTCTGAALDATHVLTANHCEHLDRIVTQTGQEAWVMSVRRWPSADVALLTTSVPLRLADYAELGEPTAGMATIWGTCAWWFDSMYRYAVLTRSGTWVTTRDGVTRLYDEWSTEYTGTEICIGDSGGVVLQGNRVVGLVVAVDSDWWFTALGVRFYAVNGARVAALIGGD